ncbi:nickel pincer cofactor biosynthesis protein LarC [Nocardioides marmorisolisilvae]|uniref:Pyridinium-3,5-bisthiocarboxylic acid mononucleotide nickel insertion protein n=1 Tax=Nocardioides marmorisolisilvae TaxID=1542737 RepID=A0A3N0E0Q6_9ACTN|nr:nickel pincer cofactor biosynthesis protein LarC [Nocardioides marmorisolisilvae]RNL81415.1 nickel pincer cofactor biosynthesis protein LarC [Nocardioides marmorisolisilvae]
MTNVGWFDASSGASGDMVLGALLDAGVPHEVIAGAVAAVAPEPITLHAEAVTRNGFAASQCHVEVGDSETERTWAAIQELIGTADLDAPVRTLALEIFGRLAWAEALVHGTGVENVHFHEVGSLDSIADVVGAAAGIVHLGLAQIGCSPVALGGGTVEIGHGRVGVPAPAVVELLKDAPTYGGPLERELTTPTGAAILASVVTQWGVQPPMTVSATGVGAGGADPVGHANVLRLSVGVSTGSTSSGEGSDGGSALVIEANVDDLDPRLWPDVLTALLEAGASDAWLTPILMKKGRPAHTLSVLAGAEVAAAVRREIFRQTSTIGVREHTFAKHALDRSFTEVELDGHRVAVKLAYLDGELVNVQPEYEDVAAAARKLGRPIKDVLSATAALARGQVAPTTG